MIPRKLVIGVVLGAIVLAMVVASRMVIFGQSATSRDKPIEAAAAQKRGGLLRVFQI